MARARHRLDLVLLLLDRRRRSTSPGATSRDTTLPPIAVMPLLAGELDKATNWQAQLPPAAKLLVSLRKLDRDEAELVLHPVGTLQVSQRAVPLDLTIDKVGNQKPSDANRFALDVDAGGPGQDRATLQEQFAPAQFQDFDDAEQAVAAGVRSRRTAASSSAPAVTLRLGDGDHARRALRPDRSSTPSCGRIASALLRAARARCSSTSWPARASPRSALSACYAGADCSRSTDTVDVSTETFAVALHAPTTRRSRRARGVHQRGGGAATTWRRPSPPTRAARHAARDPAVRGGRMTRRSPTYSFLPWLRQGIANRSPPPTRRRRASRAPASTSS